MDVTAGNFWQRLPDMLRAIAAADYVAIDLEMTGVRVRDSLSSGEVSPEQAYERARAAASTFSAVELGITAVRWVDDLYETHTFAIPISAVLPQTTADDRQLALLIDRNITFSTNSLSFLRKHSFDLEKMCEGGVPYLSREELQLARKHLFGDRSKGRIDLAALEAAESTFCDGLRAQVRLWLSRKPQEPILQIDDPRGGTLSKTTAALVNQIVADEFPQCRCWRHKLGWAINIKLRDPIEARSLALTKQSGQNLQNLQALPRWSAG